MQIPGTEQLDADALSKRLAGNDLAGIRVAAQHSRNKYRPSRHQSHCGRSCIIRIFTGKAVRAHRIAAFCGPGLRVRVAVA